MAISKTEYAYNLIKDKIISGEMAPHSNINETELQNEMGISRTPIREALRLLNEQGFVDIYPRKGIVVSAISLDLLKEIYDARLILEPIITRRACSKVPDNFLLKIERKLRNPPENMTEMASAKYYNAIDSEFHSEMIKYSQNRFFHDSMTLISEHERRIRNITFNPQTNHQVIDEHLSLISALLSRDENLVFELATKHVERAKKNAFLRILEL